MILLKSFQDEILKYTVIYHSKVGGIYLSYATLRGVGGEIYGEGKCGRKKGKK